MIKSKEYRKELCRVKRENTNILKTKLRGLKSKNPKETFKLIPKNNVPVLINYFYEHFKELANVRENTNDIMTVGQTMFLGMTLPLLMNLTQLMKSEKVLLS